MLTKEQDNDSGRLKDPESGLEMEVVDKILLMEWLAENYKQYGTKLEFVTNRSQEGAQFVKGFGGIGGTGARAPRCAVPLRPRVVCPLGPIPRPLIMTAGLPSRP